MSQDQYRFHSPSVVKVIKSHLKQIQRCEEEIALHKEKILQARVGQSVIKIGDIITWYTGSSSVAVRRGRVVAIDVANWSGEYEYRVRTLSKHGKEIGNANVTEARMPELEVKEVEPKKPVAAKKKASAIPKKKVSPKVDAIASK